jgi:uncharacterized membrane protein YfcA
MFGITSWEFIPEAWPLLLLTVTIAGLVRGFAGFGTAMIYMPVASSVFDPFVALTTMVILDLFGPVPAVPRAIRDGDPKDVARLGLGYVLTMPIGLAILSVIAPEVFRYGISTVALVLLVILVGGFRYRGVLHKWLIYVTGMLAGFFGGTSGLAGPPVILLYMASSKPVSVVRANKMLFLLLSDLLLLGVMGATGRLSIEAIVIGAGLTLPYMTGILIGTRLFDPSREAVYRRVAYTIIAISAVSGLPLWD